MRITERSFAGAFFRPTPKYYFSSNKKMMAVVTPWGQEAVSTKDIFNDIESQYNFFLEDKESTHPFAKLLSLSPIANNMRTVVLLSNENIFKSLNESEYCMGFELFFAAFDDRICTFIQIGQPLVLLDRPQEPLCNIGYTMHSSLCWNAEDSTSKIGNPSTQDHLAQVSSLPHQLLGVHPDISFHPAFVHLKPKDRLILLNRTCIPPKWFQLSREERTLDRLSQIAAEHNPHIPFWISILELDSE